MKYLSSWRVKRSGAAMFVEGSNDIGVLTRVTGVDTVTVNSTDPQYRGAIIAVDKDGKVLAMLKRP